MHWLTSHGVLDAIVFVIASLLSIMVKGLQNTIRENQLATAELAKSVAALNITISRDYVTRQEFEKGEHDIWERIDRHQDQISSVGIRVTRLEAREK